jgi:uncharacterized protein
LELLEIDGLQFARSGSEISGNLTPDQLPRLAELGCSTGGIKYRLTGLVNARGKPALAMLIEGEGQMRCQRCLEPLSVVLSGSAELELSKALAEIEQADDEIDRVLAGHAMNVAAMVEDEAILALPMVPRHDQCIAADAVDVAGAAESPQAKVDSPFSVLAALKKKGGRKKAGK